MTDEGVGTRLVGIPLNMPVSALRLDSMNPRLPESHRAGDQTDLAVVLEMGFDAFAVAQSMADYGYFAGEPMLVIPSPDEENVYVVVEGNRRLTALLGLAEPEVRSQFIEPERWDGIAGRAVITPETVVPIIVHPDRDSTHAQVARAHVVGKLPWKPYMQARFIAARVTEGLSIAEVAELIGITRTQAGNLYRDQAVVAQAERCGLETSEIEKAFSLLTVAMGNTKLRDFVGAPLGSQLVPGADPIPGDRLDELHQLIVWIFGDADNDAIITDSRQTSQLGNVVASPVGLAALRAGASLEEAKQQVAAAGMDPRERLVRRLIAAKSALEMASGDLAAYAGDEQVQTLVQDVEAVVDQLRSTLVEVEAEPGVA